MPSKKAEEYAERGWSLMQKAGETKDESAQARVVRQAMAEFALAIKEANGVYPQAHVALGQAYDYLGDRQRAFQEWDIATAQDPLNFNASAFRAVTYMDDYEAAWNHYRENARGGTGEAYLIKKVLIPAASQLQKELDRLVECYTKILTDGSSIERILEKSDDFLELAAISESLDAIPIGVAKSRDLYYAVLKAPWESVDRTAHEQEIDDILRRAEGSYELRKNLPPQKTLADLAGTANLETAKYWGKEAGKIGAGMVGEFFKAVFK